MPKKTDIATEDPVGTVPAAPIPDDDLLAQLAEGTHTGPHSVLGQHPVDGTDAVVIRVLRPLAREVVAVLDSGARIELGHIGWGVWQGVSVVGFQDYVTETVYDDDNTWTADDPDRYLPSVGESTCTCSARSATSGGGRCSARITASCRASVAAPGALLLRVGAARAGRVHYR